MDCHVYPHLPESNTGGYACTDCHTNPPEDPTREWAEAPGQHAVCAQCHSETEHGDKPIPPESICGDCHQALIDGGHYEAVPTCLSCHHFPHLPDTPMDIHQLHNPGANCSDCHSAHGGLYPDRTDCLVCHPEKEEHYPGPLCQTCHPSL